MGFKPVSSPSAVSYEGYTEVVGSLHFFDYDFFYRFAFFRHNGEVEFVVNLENHLALEIETLETLVNAYHCNLYDVCSRALYRCIYSVALCKSTYRSIV